MAEASRVNRPSIFERRLTSTVVFQKFLNPLNAFTLGMAGAATIHISVRVIAGCETLALFFFGRHMVSDKKYGSTYQERYRCPLTGLLLVLLRSY